LAALPKSWGHRAREKQSCLCVGRAFDILSEAGEDLRKLPLHFRKMSLERLLARTGAGLALSGAGHVPNFFTLLIPDRTPVFCQIVWRRQERLGVTFRELRDL
jgi:hypothetical protein